MEKKNGLFKVYTDKTKSALIDLGEGETWMPVQSNAQQYFKKVDKNSECTFGIEEDKLVYVKQSQNNSTPKSQNQRSQDTSNTYNMQMSKLKNRINARTSALDNATKIAVSDENLETQEKMKEAVLVMAKEFLQFIEGEDNSTEGENPSN